MEKMNDKWGIKLTFSMCNIHLKEHQRNAGWIMRVYLGETFCQFMTVRTRHQAAVLFFCILRAVRTGRMYEPYVTYIIQVRDD